MKSITAAILAVAANFATGTTASSLQTRHNGISCKTVWYGALAVIDRTTATEVNFLALGSDPANSLVVDTGSGQYRAQFTFSRCDVGQLSQDEGRQSFSYGVLQPGTQSSYHPRYGCITATSGDVHRLTVDTCASSTSDTILPQQWFKVYNSPQGGQDIFATVELQGNIDGAFHYPDATTAIVSGQTAVVVVATDTGKVMAFDDVHYV